MKSFFTLTFCLCLVHYSSGQSDSQSWQLPKPSGKHKIGTYLWQLTDCARKEPLDKDKSCRELAVRVWYPALVSKNVQPIPYFDGYDLSQIAPYLAQSGIKMESIQSIGSIKTNSYPDQPVAKKKKLPVILLGHGYGLSLPELHTSIAEELASQGYLVLGVNRPYESIATVLEKSTVYLDAAQYEKSINSIFANAGQLAGLPGLADDKARKKVLGEVIGSLDMMNERLYEWVKDYQLVIDHLEASNGDQGSRWHKKLDLDKIGVMGHSFGGTSAVQLLLDDARVKSAVNLDGLQMGNIYSRTLDKPVMMVSSKVYQGLSDSAFEGLAGPVHLIHPGDQMTFHNAYTDMVLWPDSFFTDRKTAIGQVDGQAFKRMNLDLALAFFKQTLKGKTADLSKVLKAYDQIKQVDN